MMMKGDTQVPIELLIQEEAFQDELNRLRIEEGYDFLWCGII